MLLETLGQRRVLAVITGTVFHDVDASLRAEPGEVRLADRLAFIDANENGTFDHGERYEITDASGQFQFDELNEGIYPVRLFDGSATQQQTFPIAATSETWNYAPTDTVDIAGSSTAIHMLSPSTLTVTELSGTRSIQHHLDFEATSIVASNLSAILEAQGQLPAGEVAPATLVTGTRFVDAESYDGFWLVPGDAESSTELIQGANVSAVALGADAKGVLLSPFDGANNVHALSFHGQEAGGNWSIQSVLAATAVTVPLDTQVLASSLSTNHVTASRTVMAWSASPANDSAGEGEESFGLEISLWSNQTATFIGGANVFVDNASELVSFDDEAGLLAVRYNDGGLGVLDVDAGFSPLFDFPAATGPATILAGGETLASISQIGQESEFSLIDLQSGNVLVNEKFDTSSIGIPQKLLAGNSIQSAFALGMTGVSKLELDRPSAHTIEVADPNEEHNVNFGLILSGENTAPSITGNINASGEEDSDIQLSPSEIADLVGDRDQDQLIALIVQDPGHGTVHFDNETGWTYEPDQDFFGTDQFAVQFSDGQSTSDILQVSINVSGLPDAPTGMIIGDASIPEHTLPEYIVGSVEVLDPDGDQGDYEISVSDPRFMVRDGELVFFSGGLDHEFEPEIPITIFTLDEAANSFIEQDIIIYIEDENDPILGVDAADGEVSENTAGQFVSFVSAEQHDNFDQQPISFSVDDDRFEIVNEDELRLKMDQMLDFEAEPLVILNVTADDGSGSSLSTEVRVTVLDLPENISGIQLSNQTVTEWVPGDEVGDVIVDGGFIGSHWELSVDDSRFEIVGSTLKLVDGIWLQRSAAEQVQLTIHAHDHSGNFDSVSESFVIEVLENGSPFHNEDDPYDVDGNGSVTPLDALAIINYLNIYGPGPVGPGDPGFGYDVNGDGEVTAIDALLVINFLNSQQGGGSVSGSPQGTSGDVGENDAGAKSEAAETEEQSPVDDVLEGTNVASPTGDESSDQFGPANDAPSIETDKTPKTEQFSPLMLETDAAEGEDISLEGASDWLKDIRQDDSDPDLEQAIDGLIELLESDPS